MAISLNQYLVDAPKRFSVQSLLSPPDLANSMHHFQTPPTANMSAAATMTPLSSFQATPYLPEALPTPQSLHGKQIRDVDADSNTLPPSPPVSLGEDKDFLDVLRDPPIYAEDDTGGSEHFSLFPDEQQLDYAQKTIMKHIQHDAPAAHPSSEEYMIVASCVMEKYNKDPAAWLARELEFIKAYRASRVRRPLASLSQPHNQIRRLQPIAARPEHYVHKRPKIPIPRNNRPRAPRTHTQSRTPQSATLHSFSSMSPPTPRVKAVSSRDDVDYNALPDLCPPAATTLPPGNDKALNVDWKPGTASLSQDPDRHLLEPAEVYCAERLRLSCATYLCSKRRIFEARVKCLRIGKEFRKTDAQQACKIDVNKASKLWTAFEKVGWFNKQWFEQYL